MKASVDTRAVNFILSILVFCTFGAKVDRYAYRYLPCPKSGTVKGVIDHSLFDMVGNHQKYLPLRVDEALVLCPAAMGKRVETGVR